MNLRVDLLLDTERRSSSVLSARSVVRIGSIVVPLVLAVGLLFFGMSLYRTIREASMLDARWKEMEPRSKDAARALAGFQTNREIVQGLQSWRNARLPLDEQMLGLMRLVPEEAQLLRLTISHSVAVTNKLPARMYAMTLQGRVTGANAELRVKEMETRLTALPPFAGATRKAEVLQYSADETQGAGKDDRLFQIACQYAPREFK